MKKITTAFICVLIALSVTAQKPADLTILITGLKNTNGQVLVALFNKPENFPDAGQATYGSQQITPRRDTVEVCFLDLLPGVYAISFVHDENNNEKMDTMVGIPKEKYGVSNNIRMGFGPPGFSEAKFRLVNDTTIIIRPSN